MNNIDDLITYIKSNRGNFDRLDIQPSAPYSDMLIWINGNDYQKLMQAMPELKPRDNEDYNDDVNGHFDLNKTSLHVDDQSSDQTINDAENRYHPTSVQDAKNRIINNQKSNKNNQQNRGEK